MSQHLCITIRFLQPFPLFHGRMDAELPEWPPSPMRAFQALVNAASLRARGSPIQPEVRRALEMLETLRPDVIAPSAKKSTVGYRAYVPHNQTDLVTAAWHRGNLEVSVASHRVEKDFRPMLIETRDDEFPSVHYIYPVGPVTSDADALFRAIRPSVRAITHLGWGIDQVVADATLIDGALLEMVGERWLPSARGGRRLRVPRGGSLDALSKRHSEFVARLQDGWTPVAPLSAFDVVRYRRNTDPPPRPRSIFRLIDENDDTVAYSHAKLIHLAGMTRHLAITVMQRNRPRDLRGHSREQWVDQYVAGHNPRSEDSSAQPHAQFSYVPLPSAGTMHTDPAVRRVMIIAPVGDEAWLDHLTQQLDGQALSPLPGTALPPGTRLELIRDSRRDGVRDVYTQESRSWASFTPVILPGHDDRKPDKTRKLILKALAQSGIDQPCEFEWSAFCRFPKSYSAHKYVRDETAPEGKRRVGYIRPDHLRDQTAVHLQVRFADPVPGPIVIGAGRHCGFGLCAAVDES